MNGSRVALDTNQAIAVLNAAANVATWITSFSEVFLPVPVVGELRFGALNSHNSDQNIVKVEQLVSRCGVLDADLETARTYAALRVALKSKGKPIPENDVWIAAICVQHSIPLASSDTHFVEVPGLALIEKTP